MPVGIATTIAVAAGLISTAAAETINPAMPVQLTVGPPAGAHPMSRVDGSRRGLTDGLPRVPRPKWTARVRGGIGLPVVVDADGSVVVAAAVAELVQFNADGAQQWQQSLGLSVATAGPVLLSNATRVVLTAIGEASGFTPAGKLVFRVPLGGYGNDPRAAPLAQDNGTFIAALGSMLLVIDSGGDVLGRAELGERVVGTLIGYGSDVVATTISGKVFQWDQAGAPRRLGSFGGTIREGAVWNGNRSLMAVVGLDRLVALDLQTGRATTRLTLPALESAPAIGADNITYVTTGMGLLVGVSSTGQTTRVALTPQRPVDPDAGAAEIDPSSFMRPSPSPIVDRAGQVAFARSDGRVGVVGANGAVSAAAGTGCTNPMGIAPAGDKRFVVACRNGTIRMYGE